MPNKCSVVGCNSGYKDGPNYSRYKFPQDEQLAAKWLRFLNRPANYVITENSFICSLHFDNIFLKITPHNFTKLNYSLNPIPTIHPLSIPQSQAIIPTSSRPLPKDRVFQPDQISIYEEKFRIRKFPAGFFDLIRIWWLTVNSKERFHPLRHGNALVLNDSKAEFLCSFSDWLITWQSSGRFGLSQQTFKALIQTNYAISELSLDVLTEGYDYVLTGRLQSDPLEKRFSRYRQMSGGRFLVSLQEVIRSESIIKLKSLLKRNIDTSSLSTPTQSTSSINDFARNMLINDCDHLQLTEDSQQVVVYIAGYISLSLSEHIQCPDCLSSLNSNLISSEYVRNFKWFDSSLYFITTLCVECLLFTRSFGKRN